MRNILSVLLLVFMLALAGCITTGPGSTGLDAVSALEQLPGVAISVADIINRSPLAGSESAKAVTGWADTVATFSADMKAGLASKDQLAGAYTALRNTAANLPIDTAAKAAMSPYLAWGDIAAQVLDLAVNVVKGAQAANPRAP